MKILQINKFFYIRGGSSRYFWEVSKLLQSHGHEVAYFSMQDRNNFPSRWSKYFVSNTSFEKVEFKGSSRKFFRMIYSIEARKKISELLDYFKPDIAHLHSIYHHLSPSIIFELKKRNVPIVQTVHDYHLVAPNHTLFHDGKICEMTKPDKYYKAILHRCVKNSCFAGFADAVEHYLYKLCRIDDYLDFFIAPSIFMRDKLVEYGLDAKKIVHLPHFIGSNKNNLLDNQGNYILYFGRLSNEKGLEFLIDVISKMPAVKLKIAGTGQLETVLKQKVKKLKLKNIQFLGFKNGGSLKRVINKSRFVVLPSLGYEIFPMSILEAYSFGKTIVANNTGGIGELIKDGYNGYLLRPNDIKDWIDKIKRLWTDYALCQNMGVKGKAFVEENFSPDKHHKKLFKIYKEVIGNYEMNT